MLMLAGFVKSGYDSISDLVNFRSDIPQSFRKELAEFSIYSSLSFFAPFLLSFSQLFLGAIVNMSLIGSAMYLKGKKILPVIVLPSLGVLSRGIIFGPMTVYLAYMIPFIWIGNSILVLSVKFFHLKLGRRYITSAVLGSVFKASFLFLSALTLYMLGIVPSALLVAMGLIQLATALIASFGFKPVDVARKRYRK